MPSHPSLVDPSSAAVDDWPNMGDNECAPRYDGRGRRPQNPSRTTGSEALRFHDMSESAVRCWTTIVSCNASR